jgi:excisionase family DNA binding protein
VQAYIGVDKVADRLGLQAEAVTELLESKRLPGIRLGAHWLIPESQLDQFLSDELVRQNPMFFYGAAKMSEQARVSDDPHPKYRVTLRGRSFSASSFIEVLLSVLRELAAADATFLDRLAAVRRRKRRYVARDPRLLFGDRVDLAEKFSKPLGDGWWVGANFSNAEKEQALKAACAVAGLRYGVDLILAGLEEPKDKSKAMAFVGMGKGGDPEGSLRHNELFAEAVEERLHGNRSS